MGLQHSKKNRLKVKVIGNNFLFTSGKIVVKKDEDFDILCLELYFDGYFPTIVRVWPQNKLSTPPTIVDVQDKNYMIAELILKSKSSVEGPPSFS